MLKRIGHEIWRCMEVSDSWIPLSKWCSHVSSVFTMVSLDSTRSEPSSPFRCFRSPHTPRDALRWSTWVWRLGRHGRAVDDLLLQGPVQSKGRTVRSSAVHSSPTKIDLQQPSIEPQEMAFPDELKIFSHKKASLGRS